MQADVGVWRYEVEVEIHCFHMGGAMAVRIEKKGRVWTVIHSRREARNAMNPESADALVDAFLAFDRDPEAAVAVLWGEGGAFCAGWDLKYCASLIQDPHELH